MSLTLGEKLRAAREERGISISEVAEQTRISPLYIESIEKDDYKVLPGGIFNKGFVRSFAKYVGVDEQEALQDYARQTAIAEPESNPDEPRTYRPEVLTDDRSNGSMLPTVIFAGIILALMTGGILFLVNYIQNQSDTPTADVSPSPGASNTQVTVNPAPAATDPGTAPAWEGVKIEFKAVTEPISLGSVVDGKTSESMLQPDQPVVFEPKENLKLRYARSRAQFANLSINGKQITLPTEPANPKRAAIEFDINRENLAQIWQAGAITFGGLAAEPVANTAVTTATPATTAPAAQTTPPTTTANTTSTPGASTPRPAPASTPARPAPKPSLTPIVVGRPANGAAPRPSP